MVGYDLQILVVALPQNYGPLVELSEEFLLALLFLRQNQHNFWVLLLAPSKCLPELEIALAQMERDWYH